MNASTDRWDRMILGLRHGDSRAAADFCAEYGPLLQRLTRQHLPAGLRRRVDPEDVVQSACFSFLRRYRGGEFQLADSEGLWRLLCTITLAKVREQTRFHLRQKRGLDQEAGLPGPADSAADLHPPAAGLQPDEEVAFADQLEHVLASLDDEERQVVALKMQDHTNEETARLLGSSERTVRRILKRVESRLTRALESD